jgi:hypothetical protein
MDQGSICLFLAMKGLSAREVHNAHVAVLGLDAIAYSTVTRYGQERQFPASSSQPCDEPLTIIVDGAILEALNNKPFSSVRKLAKFPWIPTTTVYQHLTGLLGFVLKHLRYVPQTMTDILKAQRITLSNQLLLELLSIKHQSWHFVTTIGESRFCFSTDHEQIWLQAD